MLKCAPRPPRAACPARHARPRRLPCPLGPRTLQFVEPLPRPRRRPPGAAPHARTAWRRPCRGELRPRCRRKRRARLRHGALRGAWHEAQRSALLRHEALWRPLLRHEALHAPARHRGHALSSEAGCACACRRRAGHRRAPASRRALSEPACWCLAWTHSGSCLRTARAPSVLWCCWHAARRRRGCRRLRRSVPALHVCPLILLRLLQKLRGQVWHLDVEARVLWQPSGVAFRRVPPQLTFRRRLGEVVDRQLRDILLAMHLHAHVG